MSIQDVIQRPLDGDNFAESRLEHPVEFWGPPLAPAEMAGSDDISLRQALGPATGDERFFKPRKKRLFKPLEKNDFAAAEASFEPRRKLFAGAVMLAALGITALVYIWASAGEKTVTQSVTKSEQSAPAVQSSPEAPAQATSAKPVPSPDPSVAVAWPDLPATIKVETPEVAPAVPTGTSAPHQTVSASQKPDIVFLQRPGVNIRSAPSANGRVLGKAPKGARFAVTNREGDWVQVESERFRGWIKSQFLAANEPR